MIKYRIVETYISKAYKLEQEQICNILNRSRFVLEVQKKWRQTFVLELYLFRLLFFKLTNVWYKKIVYFYIIYNYYIIFFSRFLIENFFLNKKVLIALTFVLSWSQIEAIICKPILWHRFTISLYIWTISSHRDVSLQNVYKKGFLR